MHSGRIPLPIISSDPITYSTSSCKTVLIATIHFCLSPAVFPLLFQSLNRVPSEQQGIVMPEYEEEDHDEDDPHNQYLGVPDKVWRDSVWSVLGGKLGARHGGSTSIIFGEHDQLEQLEQQRDQGRPQYAPHHSSRYHHENVHFRQDMPLQSTAEQEDPEPDTWQGSCLSFVTGQEELPFSESNDVQVDMSSLASTSAPAIMASPVVAAAAIATTVAAVPPLPAGIVVNNSDRRQSQSSKKSQTPSSKSQTDSRKSEKDSRRGSKRPSITCVSDAPPLPSTSSSTDRTKPCQP